MSGTRREVVPDVQRTAARDLLDDHLVEPQGTASVQAIGGSLYAKIPPSQARAWGITKGSDVMLFSLPTNRGILVIPTPEINAEYDPDPTP